MEQHLLWLFILFTPTQAGSNLDLLPHTAFHKEGDLNIGGLTYNQGYTLEAPCGNDIMFLPIHQRGQSIAYYIEHYNNRQDILPNVTLGYTVLDECYRDSSAIPRFIQLLPVLNNSADPHTSLSVGKHYDVVGIIGPVAGTPTIILATMTAFFQIPQIGSAPSDELSDKIRFPYYFRMIPPDRFQSYAIIKVAKELKWEYISVVYVEANYGFNANRYIAKWALEEGICIEESIGFDYIGANNDFEGGIRKLLNGKARIVVVFAYASVVSNLLKAHDKLNVGGELIWVIPESIPIGMIWPYMRKIKGSLYIQINDILDQELKKYYESINPWNMPNDPWLSQIWEQFYECKMNPKEDEMDCREFPDITGISSYYPDPLAHRAGSAVHPFAHALHQLIEDHCKYAVGYREELRECVKPEMLADYLRKVNINTPNGRVKFDENQDNFKNYEFKQIQVDEVSDSVKLVDVVSYNLVNNSILVSKELMRWPDDISEDKFNEENVPESVCSYPCEIGEMYIQGEVPCCWECKRCRNNEFVSENQTKCTVCDELTWPDPESNLTSCSPILPAYLTWENAYAIGLLCLAGSGLLAALLFTAVVIRNRDRRIIKGSSRELIAIILFGIILAYITIPSFIIKPTDIWCNFSRAGFSMSNSLVFAPLFIKSVRIYRLFSASARFEKSLKWVDLKSQMVFAGIVIGIQVCIVSITSVIWPPKALLKMPIKTTKLVELQCDLPMPGIIIPLSFNILLALLCSILGFLTRKLPENFNESWYIFVSVCTTLFIWIAFLPTYFSAFYAYHKAVLLAFALFLNCTIVLVCIFGPKVYAVYYMKDEDIKITDFSDKPSTPPLKKTEENVVESANIVSDTLTKI